MINKITQVTTSNAEIAKINELISATNVLDESVTRLAKNEKTTISMEKWNTNPDGSFSYPLGEIVAVYGIYKMTDNGYADAMCEIRITGKNTTLESIEKFNGYAICAVIQNLNIITAEKAKSDENGNNIALNYSTKKETREYVNSVIEDKGTVTIVKGNGSSTSFKINKGSGGNKAGYSKEETNALLNDKADKTQLDALATKAEIANFVTDQDVTGKGYITSAALNGYAKTIDIDTKLGKKADKTELSGLATKSEIAGFVNAETVDQKIAAADFVKPATLTSYATKVEIQDFVTDAQVTEKGYITEAALTGYEKTSSLTPKLEAKADKAQLATLATKNDISNFVTDTDVTSKGYITKSALNGYAKTQDTDTKLESKADKTELEGFIKFTPDGGILFPNGVKMTVQL